MSRPARSELPEQLLTAAAEEFAENGYHSVRIDAIADRCGVTKGAVYMHFRSKLAMFLAAHAELSESYGQAISAPPSSPTKTSRRQSARAKLRARLLAELGFHREKPSLRRMQSILDTELAREPAASGRDGLRASYRALRKDLRRLLQEATREGEVGPQDFAATAFGLVAQLEGTLAQMRAAPDEAASLVSESDVVDAWLSAVPRAPRRRGPSSNPQPAKDGDGADFRPAF